MVSYEKTSGLGTTAGGTSRTLSDLGTQLHRVALTGLQPDTTYFYRISNDGKDQLPAETLSFRTAPAAGSTAPFRFLAFGDYGTNSSTQRRLRDQMLLDSYQFILTTGDNAYDHGRYQDFSANVFAVYRDLFGRAGLYPTIGNHEYETDNGAPYLDIFDLPQMALRASDNERYYSFDYGNAHFVSLDSNAPLDGTDSATGDDMFDWLRNDLSRTTRRWKVVAFHHPAYSMARTGGSVASVQAKLVPIFEQYGVDLVLNGHDHFYSRSLPLLGGQVTTTAQGGIVYVVTGSGDANTARCRGSAWVAVQYCATGAGLYSRVSISGNRITVEAVDETGAIVDSVAWTKAQPEANPVNIFIPAAGYAGAG